MALERQQTRPQHRRADGRPRRHRHAQRREHGRRTRWACWPRCRRRRKATLTDKDARWLVRDVQAGYGSPVSDGERIYIVDNGGVLFAFDVEERQAAVEQESRHDQKSSPVLADGKLYVGTENGKFYILKPRADKASTSWTMTRCRRASDGKAVADHRLAGCRARPRLRRVDGRAVCDRTEGRAARRRRDRDPAAPAATAPVGAPRPVLVTPTEVIVKPGAPLALTVRGVRSERPPVASR